MSTHLLPPGLPAPASRVTVIGALCLQGIPGLDAPCPIGRDGLPLPGCQTKTTRHYVTTCFIRIWLCHGSALLGRVGQDQPITT